MLCHACEWPHWQPKSVRTFSSESVSGRIHQCQVGGLSGSEVESRRFPNWNANVASALQICSTSAFIASGISWVATMTSLTEVSCVQRSFPNGLIRKKVTPATGWVPQSSRNEGGVEYTVSCAPMPVARCGIRSTSRSYPAEYA
jgi:hypothetical protein